MGFPFLTLPRTRARDLPILCVFHTSLYAVIAHFKDMRTSNVLQISSEGDDSTLPSTGVFYTSLSIAIAFKDMGALAPLHQPLIMCTNSRASHLWILRTEIMTNTHAQKGQGINGCWINAEFLFPIVISSVF